MSNLGDFFSLVAEEEKKKKIELEAKLEKAKAEQEIIESLGKILSQMAENKPEIENTTEQVTEQVVVESKPATEQVEEVVKESNLGLLGGTTATKTADPLTPFDQKFVTFDDLNKHYKTYIARVQQQLSTLGGGGTNDISDIRLPTKVITTSTYNIVARDYYIGVNYAGTPVITLPINQKEGKCFIVKDERGEAENAGRFITIKSIGNELIDGEDKVILQFNYGSLTFVWRGNSWRVV
mgnify:CR=1 FL=1